LSRQRRSGRNQIERNTKQPQQSRGHVQTSRLRNFEELAVA
jgi:hypothetical protein